MQMINCPFLVCLRVMAKPMNPILANLIGYFFAVVVAHFLIAPIQDKLWSDLSRTAKRDIRPRPWHATVIGFIERTLYVAAIQASAGALIGVWLALKAASHWKGWSEGFEKEGITGRELANVFITGTGLSLVFALAGSRCIPHLIAAEWLKALVWLCAPVIGAVVLDRYIRKKTQNTIPSGRESPLRVPQTQ